MNTSSDGEVFGTNALYGAMVVGAVVLLMGSIWNPATVNTVTPSAAPAPQVQVAAVNPGHVS
jgi:hypothetical protein